METLSGPLRKRAILLFLATSIVLAAIVSVYAMGYGLLERYPADWSTFGIVKIVGLVAAALLAYRALRPDNDLQRPMGWQELPAGSIIICFIGIVATAAALIIWPVQLSLLVWETQPLAVLSDYVMVAALFFLGYALFNARGIKDNSPFGLRPVLVVSLMFAAVFVILMEEMSWGQHLLGFNTPEAFQANVQNETNFHNFYTYRFELAYYSTAIFAFVVLPIIWPSKVPEFAAGLSIYVPPKSFAILALPVCGFFYESWNSVPFQFCFYFGLIAAIHLWASEREPLRRMQISAMAMALLASQIIILIYGHNLVMGYEISEIRETAIALAILIYSFILAGRFKDYAERTTQDRTTGTLSHSR